MNLGPDTSVRMNLWTIIAVVIFSITQAVKLTTHKNTVDNRIKNLEKENEHQEVCIKELTIKVNEADVAFAEIKTKLANIEALLMEIKKDSKPRR